MGGGTAASQNPSPVVGDISSPHSTPSTPSTFRSGRLQRLDSKPPPLLIISGYVNECECVLSVGLDRER